MACLSALLLSPEEARAGLLLYTSVSQLQQAFQLYQNVPTLLKEYLALETARLARLQIALDLVSAAQVEVKNFQELTRNPVATLHLVLHQRQSPADPFNSPVAFR